MGIASNTYAEIAKLQLNCCLLFGIDSLNFLPAFNVKRKPFEIPSEFAWPFMSFPHVFHISTSRKNEAATKKTLESMQFFMNLNRHLIDLRAICMMSKLMSYVDALWVFSTHTQTHIHTRITVLTVCDVSLCPSHKSVHICRRHFMVFFLLDCRVGEIRREGSTEGCEGVMKKERVCMRSTI